MVKFLAIILRQGQQRAVTIDVTIAVTAVAAAAIAVTAVVRVHASVVGAIIVCDCHFGGRHDRQACQNDYYRLHQQWSWSVGPLS